MRISDWSSDVCSSDLGLLGLRPALCGAFRLCGERHGAGPERWRIVSPRTLFIAVLGVTLLNGFVSPVVPVVFLLSPVWMPEFAPRSPIAVFYGTSLIDRKSTRLNSSH